MATQTYNPITVFASTARTGSEDSTVVRSAMKSVAGGHTRGLALVIDCTAITSSPSVVFVLKIATGGAAFATIATSAAVTSAGQAAVMVIHPDVATDIANFADQGPMRTRWYVEATHANGNSITYSVIAFPLT